MRMNRKNIRSYFNLNKINKIIKILTFSDILLIGGFGLIAPIFAVFVTDNLSDGSVAVVGIASTVYLLTKSVGQLFAAEIVDRIKGERDDFWAVLISTAGISLVPLLYIFVDSSVELYIVQFIYGIAAAFSFPSWMALFTRHIDHNQEGREWGLYYTLTDLAGAAAAAIGGFIAARLGFTPLFIIVSAISILGTITLWGLNALTKKHAKN